MIEIVAAKRWHCGQAAHHMRTGHRQCLERLGFDPHKVLSACFINSYKARTCFIDGQMAALFGITGSVLSPLSWVWLGMTNWGARHPLAMVKAAREQLEELIEGKEELVTTVLGDDDAAQRFAAFLGFHAGHEGPARRAWSRSGRRALLNHMNKDVDLRLDHGAGFAIRLGYHAEYAGAA